MMQRLKKKKKNIIPGRLGSSVNQDSEANGKTKVPNCFKMDFHNSARVCPP